MDRWLINQSCYDKNVMDVEDGVSASTVKDFPNENRTEEKLVENESIGPRIGLILEEESNEPESIKFKKRMRSSVDSRFNKFCNSWLREEEFSSWLTKSSNLKNGHEYAFCKVCHCDITAHKNDIRRHSSSTKHIYNFKQVHSNKKIIDMISTSDDRIRRAELKLCGVLASNNLPFLIMDTLTPVLADIFPDSKIAAKISLKRTKAACLIKDSLGPVFRKRLFDNLKEPGCFFSLVMDETTDVSSIKQCAIAVIYYSQTNEVTVTFLDMVETSSGKAVDLFNCLKTCILEKDIPISNLVGFSSDTTNVMVGEHNSVFSNLKSEFPDILCVKCSCHMIHLAASKACLKLPRSVEDLLRNIGSHFSRSFSRQQKLKEFQIFFQTEIHKILLPANTRWLSLVSCVNRVLEQYEPLKAYFLELVFEDPSKTSEDILKTMNNKFTKIYLEFMSYTLGILTDFNVLFQAESQSFEIKSLNKILQRFPIIKKYTNLQVLDNEWKEHALLNHTEYGLDCELRSEIYWKMVFELKNSTNILIFPNLKKVFSFLLILPFSNACVERIFSDLKNIKTDHRNSLDTATLTSLMATKKGINDMGGCIRFEPNKQMINAKIWTKK